MKEISNYNYATAKELLDAINNEKMNKTNLNNSIFYNVSKILSAYTLHIFALCNNILLSLQNTSITVA